MPGPLPQRIEVSNRHRSLLEGLAGQQTLGYLQVVRAQIVLAAADPAFIHLKAFNLPPQEEKLVITTAGIVELGEVLARGYLGQR